MELKFIIIVAALFINNECLSYDGYKKRGISSTPRLKKCEHGMCENVPNYPRQTIMRLLMDRKQTTPSYSGTIFSPGQNLGSRAKFIGDSNYGCPSYLVSTTPHTVKDVNNVAKFVVNIVDKYNQTIVYERCDYSSPNPILAFNMTDANNKYKFKCEQKYITMKLYKLGNNNNSLDYGDFRIPSACVLKWTKND